VARDAAKQERQNISARRDAELLLMKAAGWERAYVMAHPEADLSAEDEARFREWVAARADGKPVQYITGEQEFWGLRLRVTPAVLIPRPETEHVVEQALLRLPRGREVRIADVGTGSGAIAIALAKELPLARVIATDVSAAALEIARENARAHGVAERIEVVECDLLPERLQMELDAVVSNPPYVAEGERATLAREVRDFEPASALFAGARGMDVYERLVPAAAKALKPGGWLVMEHGAGQSDALRALLGGWEDVSEAADLQGIVRVVCAMRPR
jgi:release factor glutamine methyltransferase